ncbi:hypothetical protein [Acaryochloris sp. IP29b_bin.137]|uniref:hypothetical protein n=1 Tax=Acaryochloris sp. IP29b_bin.137 TaxID=2969217 RepID=UPI002619DC82|nr:hypothetical protein [Acaryochloris sp. IP29b_bin.137]
MHKDAVLRSCLQSGRPERYCHCMVEEIFRRPEISNRTKANLAQHFTTHLNQAIGNDTAETKETTAEFNALLECYVTCLNIMVADSDDTG